MLRPLKVSLYIIHSAGYILFQFSDISGYILYNHKILIGKDSVLDYRLLIFWASFGAMQYLNSLPCQM